MIGIAKGMAATFKHLFRPTFTIQYPDVKRQLPERSRMSFELKTDEHGSPQCKACLLCEKSCPDNAIVITSEKREDCTGTHTHGVLYRPRSMHVLRSLCRAMQHERPESYGGVRELRRDPGRRP